MESLIAATKNYGGWLLRYVKRDPNLLDPLVDVLGDRDGFIQDDAARALGEIKDSRSVGGLRGQVYV